MDKKVIDKLRRIFNNMLNIKHEKLHFVQFIHQEEDCDNPCYSCRSNHLRIFEDNSNKPPVNIYNHKNCHCFYRDVKSKRVGTISNKEFNSPDVWLSLYGVLPDYYIKKLDAINKYGWNSRRNFLSTKAPNKMIGGDIYYNYRKILPEKEGRIWYECDVDYESGPRNEKRLYYSNDGLMFYSPDHGYETFYFLTTEEQ